MNLKQIYIEDEVFGDLTIRPEDFPTLSMINYKDTSLWGLTNLIMNRFLEVYKAIKDPGVSVTPTVKHKVTVKLDWEYENKKYSYIISVEKEEVTYEMITDHKDHYAVRPDAEPNLLILKDKNDHVKMRYDCYNYRLMEEKDPRYPLIIPRLFDFGFDKSDVIQDMTDISRDMSFSKLTKEEKVLFANIMTASFPDTSVVYSEEGDGIVISSNGYSTSRVDTHGSGFQELYNILPTIIYKNRKGGILLGNIPLFGHLHVTLSGVLNKFINEHFNNCKIIAYNDFKLTSVSNLQLNPH